MSQENNREEDSQKSSTEKTQAANAEIISDNLGFAEQFIEFRNSDKMTDETTMDDFLDHAEVPEDLRSDFMVAAMLKQVQDIDIENGDLKIEDSYRSAEASKVANAENAENASQTEDQQDVPVEVSEVETVPAQSENVSTEVPETTGVSENEVTLTAEEEYQKNKDEYINGGGKVSFFRGLWNLLVDGSWNPNKVMREKMFMDNPIKIDALRLMKYKDMIIDVPNVSAIFYREQDSTMVIQMTGRANISRPVELIVYQDVVNQFLAIIAVMHKLLGDKYQLSNYVIHDKCIIKKNRILSSEFKRGRGFAIIELKGGSHVNIRSTRNKYNELQALILKGHYNA